MVHDDISPKLPHTSCLNGIDAFTPRLKKRTPYKRVDKIDRGKLKFGHPRKSKKIRDNLRTRELKPPGMTQNINYQIRQNIAGTPLNTKNKEKKGVNKNDINMSADDPLFHGLGAEHTIFTK